MPQASAETLKDWPHGDSEALHLLAANFTEKAGMFSRKSPDYQPTKQEWAALQYLFEEWDYGLEG